MKAAAHKLEPCTNALRHANPKRITMSLKRNAAGGIEIALAGDGAGFDAAAAPAGRGLANMKTRAQRIGAAFELQSGAGCTRIGLSLAA